MPLYEYQCEACGRRVERIQKFSDPPLETCPHCGGKLTKLISSPAFQFKGTGWYVTDYKGTKDTKEGTKDVTKESAKEATGSKDTKADASSSSSSADSGAASSPDKPADKPSKT